MAAIKTISLCLCVYLALTCAAPALALTLEGGAKEEVPIEATTPNKPTTRPRVLPAPTDENLQPYVTDNGRGFDRCRYWKDHPDADTLRYGKPDKFGPGEPLGSTNGYNGQPAPYARCATDPCHPGGAMCWRNPKPKHPLTLKDEIDKNIRDRGCTEDSDGKLHCPNPRIRQGMELGSTPGGYDACQNPVPPPYCKNFNPQTAVNNNCRRTATGIACDTTGNGGGGHRQPHGLLHYEPRTSSLPRRPPAPFGRTDPQAQAYRQPDDLPAGRLSNGETLTRDQSARYRQPDDLPVGQISNGDRLDRTPPVRNNYRRPDDLPVGQLSNSDVLQRNRQPNYRLPDGMPVGQISNGDIIQQGAQTDYRQPDDMPVGQISNGTILPRRPTAPTQGYAPPGSYIQNQNDGPPGSYLQR